MTRFISTPAEILERVEDYTRDPSEDVRVLKYRIEWLLTQLRTALQDTQWQPISTAPPLDPVLIYYVNCCGQGRRIRARFVPQYTVEDNSNEEFFEWGPDETGPYMPEGWYEQIDNWDDYAEVFIHETPTHWMPIPAAPDAALSSSTGAPR